MILASQVRARFRPLEQTDGEAVRTTAWAMFSKLSNTDSQTVNTSTGKNFGKHQIGTWPYKKLTVMLFKERVVSVSCQCGLRLTLWLAQKCEPGHACL